MKGIENKAERPNSGFQVPSQNSYRYLFRKFTLLTVICSIVPLLLVGWGLNIHYTYFAKSRIINAFKDRVANHRRFIEQFLQEQSSKLRLVARTHSKKMLQVPENLEQVFESINRDYPSITDLGIINQEGRHLAYVGAYDLLDKNYANEEWFKQVMQRGLYISDMFMGFRQEPHFIIAVIRPEGEEKWILRATVNTNVFRSLVENVRIGKTGEVYLVNNAGIYQTNPRFDGAIMEKSPVVAEDFNDPVVVTANDKKGPGKFDGQIVGRSWLGQPRWMLVVKQSYPEAFAEMTHALRTNLIFLHISALSILVAALFITRYMVRIIKKRDDQAAQLNSQLMQASKLASIGELSAGVAHEINNPVAIIMTERQILLDQFEHSHLDDDEFSAQFLASMDQIAVQSQRCKRITHNLLRFSRRTRSLIEPVDLNHFIGEVIELMEREAKTSGIKFIAQLDPKLAPIESDPSQLQQVFLNLITNAIDAHEGKSYGSIRIVTACDEATKGVFITIEDTGSGIAKEDLDRIFDPFFTTKPVGKGTGLGLSICYSIVKQLGGNITVRSEIGEGTAILIFLPLNLPQKVAESGKSKDSQVETKAA